MEITGCLFPGTCRGARGLDLDKFFEKAKTQVRLPVSLNFLIIYTRLLSVNKALCYLRRLGHYLSPFLQTRKPNQGAAPGWGLPRTCRGLSLDSVSEAGEGSDSDRKRAATRLPSHSDAKCLQGIFLTFHIHSFVTKAIGQIPSSIFPSFS